MSSYSTNSQKHLNELGMSFQCKWLRQASTFFRKARSFTKFLAEQKTELYLKNYSGKNLVKLLRRVIKKERVKKIITDNPWRNP